ncbi:MAG: repressor LexA [Candidatus Doudnabacteria bacterium RIFCSPHIGHO2_02_FULL_48_21]|uniref:LexA repressor n=1 Tax=Candidatus Doudnabacteria bacterium RIFCSPLOWO2_02_FULL_48_13 TaxID=1817845 RepID=A0A1F5QCD5_9BACT|nr:MAG: repressor LexA [Candidatus Doudnabacteria bacterium RIFCSPHIGHO2_01_48_18]OGE77300.1 MAG: repressor LexA [Candidatus Doudnabacteria bacterium RIFCSPHIGHO2_01_FULL_48_180]OGE91019.1 MAG: repressor LexA [Candidatus Doudnabacteria bacterium RIFCSPHIGHO2_12_FULL_47_25]OGE92840.1 MAG: repressor LexA [Candidatus Doudnabacteria bacterium RIFCSPHIGHO2_02_FULL_48_21]OGE96871.1 MAG: repressor LexA [Candidatus Doudnabacteria bacterium RIFCSPLOWO2_01_FULL_48_57]OGE99430.1 MAG: repressor LexA [Cand
MLTKRQKQLLDFIKENIQGSGFPPTMSEMAASLKVKSKNAVAKLLYSLEDQGLIQRDGTARGIQVRDEYGNEIRAGATPVPVLGTITAGSPIVVEENIEEWINLPNSLLRSRKDVFLLQVRGDSMINAGILEGDLVIVRPVREVRSEDIVVALLHDEATVKRFVQINGRRYLKPENPKYQNIYPEDEWTVQGKVVGVIRQLE